MALKTRSKLLIGLAAVGLVAALFSLPRSPLPVITQANAAATIMCQGDVSGAATGSRTIGGTGSQVPSGTLYVLNGAGCALIQRADIGWFLSQGYTPGPAGGSIVFNTGVWTGTTDLVAGNIPAGAAISQIIYANTTANAVTGGISVGTTANGVDIVAAQTCAANCLTFTTDALTLKRVFSTTAAQPIHVAPVTAGNNANVNITIIWNYF